jgi:hypothetical protein
MVRAAGEGAAGEVGLADDTINEAVRSPNTIKRATRMTVPPSFALRPVFDRRTNGEGRTSVVASEAAT